MYTNKNLDSRRVAIYARFSSDQQRETSIADQVYRCREFITRAGGDAERAQVFPDFAISGASLHRPGFEKLMRAVEEKRVDVILTEDISRISRDFVNSAQLFRRLQFERIPLISIADGIDTSERGSKLSYSLRAIIAEQYRDDLKDKTIRGRILGREGILTKLTRSKVWSQPTIGAILENERYIGKWDYRKFQYVRVPGTNKKRPQKSDPKDVVRCQREDLRIIDDALWQAVQQRRQKNKKPANRNSGGKTYLLSGLLRCGVCSGSMTICTHNGVPYYRCTNRRKRHTCDNSLGIREELVRHGILSQLCALFSDRERLAYARKRLVEILRARVKDAGKELARHRRSLRKVEARIKRLVEYLADGDQSSYVKTTLQEFEARAIGIKAMISAEEQRAKADQDLPSVDTILAAFANIESLLKDDVRAGREYLRKMFKDSAIVMVPQGKRYVARSQVFASAPVELDTRKRPQGVSTSASIEIARDGRTRSWGQSRAPRSAPASVAHHAEKSQGKPDAVRTHSASTPTPLDGQKRLRGTAQAQMLPRGESYVARSQVSASTPVTHGARKGGASV